MPYELFPFVNTALAASWQLGDTFLPRDLEAHLRACEVVVAHPLFRQASATWCCVWWDRAGEARLRRYQRTHRPADLSAALAHYEASVVAAPAGSSVRTLAMHSLAVALRERQGLTENAEDAERAVEILRAAASEAARGTVVRAMVLQTLVETLLARAPEDRPWRWSLHIIEAIPELLAEAPEEGETQAQRARLFKYLGFARIKASRGPGSAQQELSSAVDDFREAHRLMSEAGQQDEAEGMAAMAVSTSQLLAHAEQRQDKAKSLEEAMAWVEEESDSQRRVERLKYLLTEAPMVGGTPEGAALLRLHQAGWLFNELHTTTSADTELVIGTVEDALTTLGPEASAELVAPAHHLLGAAYKVRMTGDRAANLEAAVTHLERSLELDPDQSPQDRAEPLLTLAEALKRRPRGDHRENIERALRCANDALQARLDQGDNVAEANARLVLGDLYNARIEGRRSDNSDRAIEELTRAAELLDPEQQRASWGSVQHNLGVAYANRRWHGASEENLRRAIHHYRLSLSAHTREDMPYDWALSQLTLANAYSQLAGDLYDRAASEEHLQAAVTAYLAAAEVFDRHTDPLRWAGIQANLGATFVDPHTSREPDHRRAARHFRAALDVIDRDSDPWLWAWCTSGLGSALMMRAHESRAHTDPEAASHEAEAERYLREGMHAMESAGTRVEWARSAMGLCELLNFAPGQDEAARTQELLKLGKRILEVLEDEGVVHTSYTVMTFVAGSLARLGLWDEAAKTGLRGLASFEFSYRAALLRTTKQVESVQLHRLTEVTVVALQRTGQTKEALLTLERGRARELAEALARDRADLTQVAEADPAAYEEYRAAAEAAAAIEAAERAVSARTRPRDPQQPIDQASETEKEHLHLLAEAQRVADRLEAAVLRVRKVDGFAQFLLPPGIETVEKAVRPRQPLVYLLPGSEATEALVAAYDAQGELHIDGWTLPDLTRDTVAHLATGTADPKRPDRRLPGYLTTQETAKKEFKAQLPVWMRLLGERLAAPLAERLADLRPDRVALVPCGLLSLFPLPSVPYDQSGHCLLTDHETVMVPSAQALAASHAAVAEGRVPGSFTGVGDPTGDLPFARSELVAVAALLPDTYTRTLLLGDEASIPQVDKAVRDAGFVHFACHADFRSDQPLESALVLAGGARFTLGEIMSRRAFRRVRLVVASACRTGTTSTVLPDEATGLATGLLQAGSAAVVASLWKVSDVSSALLMARFYALLFPANGEEAPSNPARALREAQLWLRDATARELAQFCRGVLATVKTADNPTALRKAEAALTSVLDQDACPFEDPFYWASYVLVGA
ncbi:CHAT domain-containing protein [Streptomyces sp. NBC_01443]|uniref:CHAT domain-containing protein n=1 Tax=Streptomyces sp. NBC_01443 TaxID=2903868 RepID=UPI00225B8080|nr:CHAT domain-containing protein [Streptomyces sp. NBC_01443]MCX4632876.1 CHAT domain-containing protein [Streptomyces sp. NBC_01443]